MHKRTTRGEGQCFYMCKIRVNQTPCGYGVDIFGPPHNRTGFDLPEFYTYKKTVPPPESYVYA